MYSNFHSWLKAEHRKRDRGKPRCYCWQSLEVLSVLAAPLPWGWVNKIWSRFFYSPSHFKSRAAFWIIHTRNSQTPERDEIKTKTNHSPYCYFLSTHLLFWSLQSQQHLKTWQNGLVTESAVFSNIRLFLSPRNWMKSQTFFSQMKC